MTTVPVASLAEFNGLNECITEPMSAAQSNFFVCCYRSDCFEKELGPYRRGNLYQIYATLLDVNGHYANAELGLFLCYLSEKYMHRATLWAFTVHQWGPDATLDTFLEAFDGKVPTADAYDHAWESQKLHSGASLLDSVDFWPPPLRST